MDHKITEIFYLIDEFCKEYDKVKEGHILEEKTLLRLTESGFLSGYMVIF